jgi:transmembrane serine protease 9
MCWNTLPTEYAYYGGHIANSCGARCVAIQECRQLLSLLKQRPLQPQTIAKLRQAQCGFEGRNPKVCCPSSSVVEPLSPEGPPDTPPGQDVKPQDMTQTSAWESHPKARLIPAEECGIDNTVRIWGGNRTDLGQYPWAALLQYQSRKCSNEAIVLSSVVGWHYIW